MIYSSANSCVLCDWWMLSSDLQQLALGLKLSELFFGPFFFFPPLSLLTKAIRVPDSEVIQKYFIEEMDLPCSASVLSANNHHVLG